MQTPNTQSRVSGIAGRFTRMKPNRSSKKAEAYYLKFIFCWVMHEQSILDAITNRLDTDNCKVTKISLTADEINLRNRLASDITRGIRTADIIDRSVARINLYSLLDTVKIDTSNKTVCEIANEIIAL